MARRRLQRGGSTYTGRRSIGGRRYGRVSRTTGGNQTPMRRNRRRRPGRGTPRPPRLRTGGRMQYGGRTTSIVNGSSGTILRAENQAWRCPAGSKTISADCVEETTLHQSGYGGTNYGTQKRSHKRRRKIRPAREGRQFGGPIRRRR